jgi:pyruvate ferredoxin oxidoreductase alpha subunit
MQAWSHRDGTGGLVKPGLQFISGNEAVAAAVALASPAVIAVYPITPQTTIVEKLAEWHADGHLPCQFLHMESEHSALSAAMGASALGSRAFTATSSQGLLYMCECLHYAAGGRFPIVMVNANRSVALPWNIYGDQRDIFSQLDCGWIQLFAEDAQEALDLALQAFRLAEHPEVLQPVMLNVDGFSLTHTYEPVDVPAAETVRAFLPALSLPFRMDLENPRSLGFSAGPAHNAGFLWTRHQAQRQAEQVFDAIDADFGRQFGRARGGALECWKTGDAEVLLVTLGSISGLARDVVDTLRAEGCKVGLVRLRMVRPFPDTALRKALLGARVVAVLEKNLSVGFEGTLCSQVRAALQPLGGASPHILGYSGGLGGRDISAHDLRDIFQAALHAQWADFQNNDVHWVDPGVEHD